MSIRTRISPLSGEEVAFLLRPENAELHEAYGDALAGLHGEAARYSGSWYFVSVPDEAEALAVLEEDVARLAASPGLVARMRANVCVVQKLKEAATRDGLTDEVRAAAADLMQSLAIESEALYFSEGEPRAAARRTAAG